MSSASSSHARRRRSRIRARIWRSGRGGASLRSRRCWRSCAAARRADRSARSSSSDRRRRGPLRALPRRPRRAQPRVAPGVRAGAATAGGLSPVRACGRRAARPRGGVRSPRDLGARPAERSPDGDPIRDFARARVGGPCPALRPLRALTAARARGDPRQFERRSVECDGRRAGGLPPPGAEATLRGGADGVRTIAYSPDGGTLASADFDGTVRLWDTKARVPLGRPFRAHAHEVWGLSFSRDGRTLASSSFDGTVRLWNVQDQRPLGAPIDARVGAVRSVAFSPDGRNVAFAGSDDSVRLWDVSSFEEAHPPLQGHRSSVMTIAYSPDGRTLASGGADRTVRLWDVSTGEQLGRTLTGHADKVVSVAFSPDGRTLASSDLAGTVRLWDVDKTEPRGEPLRGRIGQVWSVAFSPDGKTLAASGFDGTAAVGRADRPRLGKAASGPLCVRSSPSRMPPTGRSLPRATTALSGYGTSDVVTFSAPRSESIRTASPPLRSARTGALRPAASTGPCGSGTFRARRPLGSVSGAEFDSIESLEYSPDGRTLAVADVDGSIWLVSVPGGAPTGRLAATRARCRASHSARTGPPRLRRLRRHRTALGRARPAADRRASPDTRARSGPSPSAQTGPPSPPPARTRHCACGTYPDAGPQALFLSPTARWSDACLRGRRARSRLRQRQRSVRLWDTRARTPLGSPCRATHQTTSSTSSSARTAGSSPPPAATAPCDCGTYAVAERSAHRSEATPGRPSASPLPPTVVRLCRAATMRPSGVGADSRTSLADLEAQVCELVVGNLTLSEWDALVPGLAYRTTAAVTHSRREDGEDLADHLLTRAVTALVVTTDRVLEHVEEALVAVRARPRRPLVARREERHEVGVQQGPGGGDRVAVAALERRLDNRGGLKPPVQSTGIATASLIA